MKKSFRLRAVCAVLAAVLWLSPFAPFVRADDEMVRPHITVFDEDADEKPGIDFRLGEAKSAAPATERAPVAPTEKLPEAETAALLARLPAQRPPAPEEPFRFPVQTVPRPKTGNVLPLLKPSTEAAPVRPAAPVAALDVVRFAPNGYVAVAPNLTVVFSQPMMAIDGAVETVVTNPPVELTPQPPGRWRWLDTRTLRFEPDGRFPMATEYAVRIPAGTHSALGGVLAREVGWTFRTPAPRLIRNSVGDEKLSRKGIVALGFDQPIRPEAVLPFLKATASKKPVTLTLVPPPTVAGSDESDPIRDVYTKSGPQCAMTVRVSAPDGGLLPPGTQVELSLLKGAPAVEGPRVTPENQSVGLPVMDSFKVVKPSDDGYQPWGAFEVEFSQKIDAESFVSTLVTVEPKLERMEISAYGNEIRISGTKKPRATYRVTLSPDLASESGERLGVTPTLVLKTGDLDPYFSLPGEPRVVLDPFGKPRLWLESCNHREFRLAIHAVSPEDWPAFVTAFRSLSRNYSEKAAPVLPGRPVFKGSLPVRATPNEPVETGINFAPYINDGTRHFVVLVTPVLPFDPERTYRSRPHLKWISLTNLGIDAIGDGRQGIARVVSLRDGTPVAGAEVSFPGSGFVGRTDAAGQVVFSIQPPDSRSPSMLVARSGGDVNLLPLYRPYFSDDEDLNSWRKLPLTESRRWFVFDDRGLYRPGERVTFKGWIRQVGFFPAGDVSLPGIGGVTYTVLDPTGKTIGGGECAIDASGGFDGVFRLPEAVQGGTAKVKFSVPGTGDAFEHSFKIAAFRRPEFETKVTPNFAGPYILGDPVTLTAEASYFSGGPLAGADMTWSVQARFAEYAPPNWNEFVFGEQRAWWSYFYPSRGPGGGGSIGNGRTDAGGRGAFNIDVTRIAPTCPVRMTAEVTTQDVNRQTMSAKTEFLVHPSSVYVGIRAARTFVEAGLPLDLDLVVTDIDGKPVAGRPVRARLTRIVFERNNGEYGKVEKESVERELISGDGPIPCAFTPKEGGFYRVTVTTADARERVNRSELDVQVVSVGSASDFDLESYSGIELISDRKTYAGGETAEILVNSPFPEAEGLAVVSRDGILSTERFHMTGRTHVLQVPIKESWTPNVRVEVFLRTLPGKDRDPVTKTESREIRLDIPPVARRLQLSATPLTPVVEPGRESSVVVQVRDATGKPVAGGTVAVVVSDESVLKLGGYALKNPLDIFYPERFSGVVRATSREDVIRDHERRVFGRDLVGMASSGRRGGAVFSMAPGGAGGGGRGEDEAPPASKGRMPEDPALPSQPKVLDPDSIEPPIQLRTNFDPLANFSPSVTTDAEGKAVAKVKFPDNLTRYRVTAVAVSGEKCFGTTESNVTARLPLMVRPSAPRFLNYGDRCEFPVVIQNQSGTPQNVAVAIRTSNARLLDGAGRRVTIPANDRVEVRFPLTTERPGEARFEIAAAAPGIRPDGAWVSCPVYNPQTAETFAVYGEIDVGAAVQPVAVPAGALPGFGKLEVTASATQLQSLTDAYLYLENYPYECNEQLASRMLSTATMFEVLGKLGAGGVPSRGVVTGAVSDRVKKLEKAQKSNGGFGFWTQDSAEYPFLGVFAALAFRESTAHRFNIPPEMLDRSRNYLKNIEQFIPEHYSRDTRRSLIAFALSVRARAGDVDRTRVRRLVSDGLETLPLEAVGWLLFATAGDAELAPQRQALLKVLNNRVTETAGKAHFVTSYRDDGEVMLASDRRADGVVLDALIATDPKNDLIPKLARGLLDGRAQGRWATTQENVFALLALERYFRTYENVTPDFVARLWLGEKFAGEQAFRGRTADSRQLAVPLGEIPAGGAPLTLQKDGAGRLYYRAAMTYAPLNPDPKPFAAGFEVERVYEAVDDPADVRRDADGTWRIRAGARIRVKLVFSTDSVRYHVALADPLPAGLEALNPELAGTQAAPPDSDGTNWNWRRWWYSHQNLRDDRAEAFTETLWPGRFTYVYYARATTPGVFRVAPAKAEEMYHSETFGRTGAGRVVVE
jgi:uncharacterized protein YfaS (alpha-2-macroglobulin family)